MLAKTHVVNLLTALNISDSFYKFYYDMEIALTYIQNVSI